MKKVYTIITSMTLVLGMSTTSVVAENKTPKADDSIVKLETVSCRRLLKLNDSQKEAAIMFFHGYISGQKGDLEANTDTLADVSDKVIDTCIDNPDANLLGVFQKYRG